MKYFSAVFTDPPAMTWSGLLPPAAGWNLSEEEEEGICHRAPWAWGILPPVRTAPCLW